MEDINIQQLKLLKTLLRDSQIDQICINSLSRFENRYQELVRIAEKVDAC